MIREHLELDVEAIHDFGDFAHLARVRRGDEQYASLQDVSDDAPLDFDEFRDAGVGEREQRVERVERSNGGPSAVPWTSMNRPSPVLTTFMSTSARESSSYARSSSGSPSTMPTLVAAT